MLEHTIIEDGICDICEDRAVPYDDDIELPYCAKHHLEYCTGWALEDFTDMNAEASAHRELHRLTHEISDSQGCSMCCDGDAVSRIMQDESPSTVTVCTEDAVDLFCQSFLIERADWMADLAEEFEE